MVHEPLRAWTLYNVPDPVRARITFLARLRHETIPETLAFLLREAEWMA